MRYFREHVVADYLSGGFDGDGELIMLVHGEITPSAGRARWSSGCSASARTSPAPTSPSRSLPDEQRTPYTLLVGMRSWLFAAFSDLKRAPPS